MVDNSEGESDGEYTKGKHESGGDDTDDEGGPNTIIAIQHVEDTPSFMQALHIEAMHASEFPEYANIVSGNVADGEFYGGMMFNDQEAIV